MCERQFALEHCKVYCSKSETQSDRWCARVMQGMAWRLAACVEESAISVPLADPKWWLSVWWQLIVFMIVVDAVRVCRHAQLLWWDFTMKAREKAASLFTEHSQSPSTRCASARGSAADDLSVSAIAKAKERKNWICRGAVRKYGKRNAEEFIRCIL